MSEERLMLREAMLSATEVHGVQAGQSIAGLGRVLCTCGENLPSDAWGEHIEDAKLDALLAHAPVLLRVLLEARKPCPEYHHNAFGAEAPCATCDGGSVPLVDREQVLAALGMERVSSRRWNPEWNVWDYWTPERFEAEGDHRGWELVFAFRVPVPEPSEGENDEG